MAILSKRHKPDNSESHNSLKISFTNIWGLHLNFIKCEFILKLNSDILAPCETNLNDPIDPGNFSVRVYLPLIQKNSATHMHDLAVYVYVKKQLFDFSLESSVDTCLCFAWLYLYQSPSLALCTIFDAVLSNIDYVCWSKLRRSLD